MSGVTSAQALAATRDKLIPAGGGRSSSQLVSDPKSIVNSSLIGSSSSSAPVTSNVGSSDVTVGAAPARDTGPVVYTADDDAQYSVRKKLLGA